MLVIKYTSRFKKDVKRLVKRSKHMAKLHALVDALSRGEALPAKYRDHRLTGNWNDCRECHIEPDWLLVYQVDASELRLIASGSHADIFE